MSETVRLMPAISARANARAALLAARAAAGHWEGELSSSALATATAVIAIGAVARRQGADPVTPPAQAAALIERGVGWLVRTQQGDGGWGDTTASAANVSTTALCWAALAMAPPGGVAAGSAAAAEGWIARAAGDVTPARLARVLEARYGADRTFSVPILTALAIAGRLGPDGWRVVPQLPFELAACPPRLFAWLRLPVVSYALPALIAIGQARHVARATRNPVARALRAATRTRTLATLAAIQPSSGGFLEATPLTSFVVMSLAASGLASHQVVRRGLAFIQASIRDDGSWPIDTNLATWVTTLAIGALSPDRDADALPAAVRADLLDWLLAQQGRVRHPYTQAAPGGWAWTDLPGGVPDADDTAGALLAVRALSDPADPRARAAAAAGVRWLIGLQNRDGGVPTFCRGWTGLPFDRSGADLTAHAVRGWLAWRDVLVPEQAAIDAALAAAARYLAAVQHESGAFAPLWFGNEAAAGECNLTYGTARVLPALRDLAAHGHPRAAGMAGRAAAWLVRAQRDAGGWGGEEGAAAASIEETALAVAALVGPARDGLVDRAVVDRGLAWLEQATAGGREFRASPIGLYFAKLWYSERLYPAIFTVAAFESAARAGVGHP